MVQDEKASGASSPVPRTGVLLLLGFAAAKLLIHLLVGPGYGYFRDEFYYIACSDHLDWGYVDHPPLSLLLLRLGRAVLGQSVVAIRLIAAVAGAATVVLAGWMSREMGGGRFAAVVAMTATLIAPYYLGAGGYFSMNAFDVLIWAAAAALLIRILRGSPGLWPWLGLVLGLGLMNKLSVLWLGLGLALGLLLTPARRQLRTPGPWLAGAIAIGLFLPHVIWQTAHDWPTLEFIRNATGNKMRTVAPAEFFSDQVSMMHPLNLPIWLAGLAFLLFMRDGRKWRMLGVVYLAVMVLLIVNGSSRPGYLGPAYTALLAAGGIVVERWFGRLSWRWPRVALPLVLLAGGAMRAPFTLPLLPVDTYVRYARLMGVGPSTHERKELAELPQHYADMFGWRELVDELFRVYEGLSPAEREVAGIFVYNYGEAGAIDLLGRRLGLPRAASGHNNYWLWGPRGHSGELLIVVGGSAEGLARRFESVVEAGRTACRYCMPYENDQPIFVCRKLRQPLAQLWPSLKHFD